LIDCPSPTWIVAPYGTESRLRTWPSRVWITILPSREVMIRFSSRSSTIDTRSRATTPAIFDLRWFWAAIRAAVPPMWKVRRVSWVPGSPIDWAARIPTASPMSTGPIVARLRP